VNTREELAPIVEAFYEKAKADVLIGYHFRRIEDFAVHIPRIVEFWEIQLQGKSLPKSSPPFDVIGAHLPLGIHRGEVGRWVRLFEDVLRADRTLSVGLKQKWQEKLLHFEKVFLSSPLLFRVK